MKDAMIVIAKFNQLQNQKLFRLLDGLTDEQRKADVKTNYTLGSIHGALDRMAGTLAMSLNMLSDNGPDMGGPGGPGGMPMGGPGGPGGMPMGGPGGPGGMPMGGPGGPGGPGGHDMGSAKYDVEDYEALKKKITETDAAYVAGFEAISEEKCVASPGVPLYDMVMKGMFISNFVRGAVCQVLKAEYGIDSDLISGALLSE